MTLNQAPSFPVLGSGQNRGREEAVLWRDRKTALHSSEARKLKIITIKTLRNREGWSRVELRFPCCDLGTCHHPPLGGLNRVRENKGGRVCTV